MSKVKTVVSKSVRLKDKEATQPTKTGDVTKPSDPEQTTDPTQPKAKKEIKPLKPLTLKDIMNNDGSPGPFLPGPDYVSQYLNSAHNHPFRWM